MTIKKKLEKDRDEYWKGKCNRTVERISDLLSGLQRQGGFLTEKISIEVYAVEVKSGAGKGELEAYCKVKDDHNLEAYESLNVQLMKSEEWLKKFEENLVDALMYDESVKIINWAEEINMEKLSEGKYDLILGEVVLES